MGRRERKAEADAGAGLRDGALVLDEQLAQQRRERRLLVVVERDEQAPLVLEVRRNDALEQQPALLGEHDQGVAAVAGVGAALDEALLLEPVHADADRPRREAELVHERALRHPGRPVEPGQGDEDREARPREAVTREHRLEGGVDVGAGAGEAGDDADGGEVELGPGAIPVCDQAVDGVGRDAVVRPRASPRPAAA